MRRGGRKKAEKSADSESCPRNTRKSRNSEFLTADFAEGADSGDRRKLTNDEPYQAAEFLNREWREGARRRSDGSERETRCRAEVDQRRSAVAKAMAGQARTTRKGRFFGAEVAEGAEVGREAARGRS